MGEEIRRLRLQCREMTAKLIGFEEENRALKRERDSGRSLDFEAELGVTRAKLAEETANHEKALRVVDERSREIRAIRAAVLREWNIRFPGRPLGSDLTKAIPVLAGLVKRWCMGQLLEAKTREAAGWRLLALALRDAIQVVDPKLSHEIRLLAAKCSPQPGSIPLGGIESWSGLVGHLGRLERNDRRKWRDLFRDEVAGMIAEKGGRAPWRPGDGPRGILGWIEGRLDAVESLAREHWGVDL